MDAKDLFSSKSETYDRYRPEYSPALIEYVRKHYHVSSETTIGDIGAGTGILTRQLLELNCPLFAIEPNGGMRSRMIEKMGQAPNCRILGGSAEETGLPDHSIDIMFSAQAFHWFDADLFRKEFRRFTKTGQAMLIWNSKNPSQPYLRELERLNREFCPRFRGFSGGYTGEGISYFFENRFTRISFENNLHLNREEFVQGILTASYTPDPDDENYERYVMGIEEIFMKFGNGREIDIENETEAYLNCTGGQCENNHRNGKTLPQGTGER
ncbi:MAG: methyltransferase domain-containing protein [Spirochaetales bacterium]|nr:methyltransferase domain-containing protein [Spirochaetales bacterium]